MSSVLCSCTYPLSTTKCKNKCRCSNLLLRYLRLCVRTHERSHKIPFANAKTGSMPEQGHDNVVPNNRLYDGCELKAKTLSMNFNSASVSVKQLLHTEYEFVFEPCSAQEGQTAATLAAKSGHKDVADILGQGSGFASQVSKNLCLTASV